MAEKVEEAIHKSAPLSSMGRPEGFMVAQRYRIEDRLGGGAFGEVFRGRDIKTGRLVAFKLELSKESARTHLNFEYKIYRRFNECPVTVGVPQVYYCGAVGEYTVLVMDLLGPCLEELFNLCHRKFSVKTVCMLGLQIVERLQYMHNCGYLHRDIKPENFVMGLGARSHIVYIIDVGLAKAWRDSNGKHISYTEGKSMTGTARYVSINTHEGRQQSRRDDLESVTYLLLYFLRGSLPWQGLKAFKSDPRYERIRNVKATSTPESLAQGFPVEFATLVGYARSLEFTDEPNYNYCTRLIFEAMGNADLDYHYQWNLKALPPGTISDTETSTTDCDRRRNSRHSTAIATGGDSSMLAGSAYVGEGGQNSAMPSLTHALSAASASYANFLEDMQDNYGFGDYY